MARKGRVRLRRLGDELLRAHPWIDDPDAAIACGAVLVDGRVLTNPASLVRGGAAIELRAERQPRGRAKLEAAFQAFGVDAREQVALDVGAAAGGFTSALLAAGARRVYAVDAGHGQLLGSLRQDPRVVNLEGVNLGVLGVDLVPDEIGLVTMDLSYLALAEAVPQLEAVHLAGDATAVALVKPQFELGLAAPPGSRAELVAALERACDGFARSGWTVRDAIESPLTGRRGAVEFLVHASRATAPGRRPPPPRR